VCCPRCRTGSGGAPGQGPGPDRDRVQRIREFRPRRPAAGGRARSKWPGHNPPGGPACQVEHRFGPPEQASQEVSASAGPRGTFGTVGKAGRSRNPDPGCAAPAGRGPPGRTSKAGVRVGRDQTYQWGRPGPTLGWPPPSAAAQALTKIIESAVLFGGHLATGGARFGAVFSACRRRRVPAPGYRSVAFYRCSDARFFVRGAAAEPWRERGLSAES